MPPAMSFGLRWFESDARREAPRVSRTIDADVGRAGLHAEGVEQTMVMVRVSLHRVHRDVQLIRALDELEALDCKGHGHFPVESFRIHLLDEGVRSIAAHTLGVEQADAEYEVGRRSVRHGRQPD